MVNSASTDSTTGRVTFTHRGSCIIPPPGRDGQVDRGDQEKQQQQQHTHRRTETEVPGDERILVDVHRDQVGRPGRGLAEEYVRGVEVVERPQHQYQDQYLVDRAQHRQPDAAYLLSELGPDDRGRRV